MATGARGRLDGWNRPSRRPSGPGKMTAGMSAATCFWVEPVPRRPVDPGAGPVGAV